MTSPIREEEIPIERCETRTQDLHPFFEVVSCEPKKDDPAICVIKYRRTGNVDEGDAQD